MAWRMRETKYLTDTICSTAHNPVRHLRSISRSQTTRSGLLTL
jgi:hypothetical protein